MANYKLELHDNAPDAIWQIKWHDDYDLAFFNEFHDKFPKYGIELYNWSTVLNDRYSVFVIMIGGFFSPRVTVVSDAQTGRYFLLGLVRGENETDMNEHAYELTCRVLGLSNPTRVDNPD